jgi:hypothetical protein
VLTVVAACVAILGGSLGSAQARWPAVAFALALGGVLLLVAAIWRTASTLAGVHRVVLLAMEELGAVPVTERAAQVRYPWPRRPFVRVARSALASLFVIGIAGGTTLVMQDAWRWRPTRSEALLGQASAVPLRKPTMPPMPRLGLAIAPNGDVYLSDAQDDVIRRVNLQGVVTTLGAERAPTTGSRPAGPTLRFDTPGGVSVGPHGDVYVADSQNHRICRIDRLTGAAIVVAGTGRPGFGGDGGPAIGAALDWPSALAFDRKGDLYIADAGNHRIRKVVQRTGIITTVAGDGDTGPDGEIGDGGPAVRGHLYWPTDLGVARNGDLFIADTEHNRVRRVDMRTGLITTVAGNGTTGLHGDGGPATKASLSAPTGLALVDRRGRLSIYIADSSNGRVRVVAPDGTISSLSTGAGNAPIFANPARLAYHSRGWLYVVDTKDKEVKALSLAGSGVKEILPPLPHPPAPRRVM